MIVRTVEEPRALYAQPGERALLIPDSPGNNRLDSLQNILANTEVGLLFLIPDFDETLRVNGRAVLSRDDTDLPACRDQTGSEAPVETEAEMRRRYEADL